MIRHANKFDKDHVLELLREAYADIKFETKINIENYEYQGRVFDAVVAGRGVIFLEENKGLLGAIIAPTFFDNKTFVMNCMAWIVRPKYRNTRLAYALMKEYIAYGEKLKQEGRIAYYTIGKTPHTPDMDYTKLGFRKTDETWAR